MKARHEFHNEDEYKKYLRIYFAGLALQGLLANPNPGTIINNAIDAVYAADTLIEALNK